MNESIRLKLSLLPDSPGCYIMRSEGEIIYVGKAVNLKNRVRSYFHKEDHTPKVAAMVARIDDFDTMLCSTNLEALMLECNLIKQHRPYYNILLKDDKHYPYLRIDKREPFARLTITRRMENDGALYFGPYIGTNAVRQVFGLLRKVFPLRSCNKKLPLKQKIRPCVNYEIGRCLGPCAEKCTQEEYAPYVEGVIGFLKGQYRPIILKLKEQMQTAALAMQYERAAELRDCIRDVEGLMEQQNVLQTSGAEQDVIALAMDGIDAMVQVLFVRGGRMIGGDHFALPGEGNEPPGEVLDGFLLQYYEMRRPAREVIVCDTADAETLETWLRQQRGGALSLHAPKRGAKRELVAMAEKNAGDALMKRNANAKIKHERTVGASESLGNILGLGSVPRRIEGFDISNTQGSQSVASMVVFIDGAPQSREYRRFKIKTVEGANDFASMHEVLQRRFRRVKAENERERWPLPDLILVDGGPQQLAFALDSMRGEGFDVPMFGLAERLEEIWLEGAEEPIVLDKQSPVLHLVQSIRDEAHRFAIIHHRGLRDKHSLHSRLEEVPGIGPARRRALLAHFKTIRAIGEAGIEQIAAVKGMNKASAEALYRAMHPDEASPDTEDQP